MADEKIIIQIEADGSNVEKVLESLGKKSKKIGDDVEGSLSDAFKIKSLVDLKAGFDIITGAAGKATEIIKGFGDAIFNAALEGEKIGVINNQFELLSKQAGISADAISQGLVTAADGLADTEDILQAASQGIVAFGKNAERLPEIFALARQASQIFGGDVVQRFEELNQAIASGQTRSLKNLGIIIDQKQAYDDFAKSLGVTASSLNESQRQQAFLNAVLERGRDAFSGVDLNANILSQSSTRLNVALGELNDTISLLAKDTFGNFFQESLRKSADAINDFNLQLKNATGNATVDEQIQLLQKRNAELEKQISINEQLGGSGGLVEVLRLENEGIKNQLSLLTERNDAVNEAAFQRALKAPAGAAGGLTPEQEKIAAEESIKTQNAVKEAFLQAERDKLAALQQRIAFTTDEEIRAVQQIAANELQQNIITTESELKKQALIKSFDENKITDKATQNELLLLQEQTFQERLILLDEQTKNIKLENVNTFKNGFISAQQEALKQLQGFDKYGKTVFNSYKNNAVNAFLAVGAGAISAGEAVKQITFGVIADTAQAKGTEMLLAGIWPPNPPALAGGAALIALAGALRAKSKGGSDLSGGTPSAAGGGAAVGGGTSFGSPDNVANNISERTTAVQIDVQGTVLNPIQVGQQIAQILNDTFDATGTRVTTGAA